MTGSRAEAGSWWQLAGMLGVAVVWLAAARLLPLYGIYLIPMALARQLTLQMYLMLMQTLAASLGLTLALIVLRKPRAQLGVSSPVPGHLAIALLAAPVVYVLSSYVAVAAAFKTLIEELARGGAELARQNAGEFGRSVRQDPVWLTVAWIVVFAPVTEELLFRGALWSSIANLTKRWVRPRAAHDPLTAFLEAGPLSRGAKAAGDWLLSGGVATLVGAGVFAWMHADMKGGAGIVRVVSALGLGLACGVGRQASGALAVPIALHAVYNLLSLGQTRRWWVVGPFAHYFTVPTLASLVAAACCVALAAVGVSRLVRRER